MKVKAKGFIGDGFKLVFHCEEGPAIEYDSGTKFWYLNGEEVTEEEHKKRTSSVKTLKIDGIKWRK